jgi:hypothetical protein
VGFRVRLGFGFGSFCSGWFPTLSLLVEGVRNPCGVLLGVEFLERVRHFADVFFWMV